MIRRKGLVYVLVAAVFAGVGAVSASPCTEQGAFGIEFGSKPPKSAKRTEGGNASVWFTVVPPQPDPFFDSYQIRVDAKTNEIFEITATKQVTRPPELGQPPLPVDVRKQGEAKALALAEQYLKNLPAEDQPLIEQSKYKTPNWTLQPKEGFVMELSANFAWDVILNCKDIRRENMMGCRMLPELCGGK